MKKERILSICVICLTVLLLILAFEWFNVQDFYADQSFVGKNVDLELSRALLIIKILSGIGSIALFTCVYELGKLPVRRDEVS